MAVLNRRNMISDHRRHDRLMIARLASGDSFPTELDDARALVAGCPDCAALADDIRLLSRSVSLIPAAARARDFRLTVEQADRLRGTWLERFMRRVGAPGWGAMRPLAGVAISLGLVMTVIGSLPVAIPLAGSAADGDNRSVQAPELAPATMAGEELAPAAGPDEAPGDATSGDQPAETFGSPSIARSLDDAYLDPSPDAGISAGGPPDDAESGAVPLRQLMLYAGLGMASLGFGLIVLVWLARRRFTDPLLR